MQIFDPYPVPQGNTYPGVRFTLPSGAGFDLTGALIEIELRLAARSDLKASLSSAAGNDRIVITGDYTFEIPPQIIDLPANTYVYDIKITFADGRVKTYIGGTWKILSVVTD